MDKQNPDLDNSKVESTESPKKISFFGAIWSVISTFFSAIFYLSLFVFILLVLGMIGFLVSLNEQLPDLNYNTYNPELTTFIYDSKGKVITRLHSTINRTEIVPLSQISPHLRNAVIAIEDERFYNHYGVDPKAILRATFKNLLASIKARKLRMVQGASTLTQQLAKCIFLTREKKLIRKIKDQLLALKIERKYTKDEILEFYLNEVPFGHGAYGIASAAWLFFSKEPSELTLGEASTLAGIIQSPWRFSILRKPEKAKVRQKLVLNNMLRLKYITQEEYQATLSEPIQVKKGTTKKWKSPYFVSYVLQQLIDMFGKEKVYTGGLKVYTTLDLEIQKYADESVEKSDFLQKRPSETFPDLNVGLIALEVKTGHIKAMVGGRNYYESKFNRSIQASRQPGSSFKPIVYATAIDHGIPPNQIIDDSEISFENKWTGEFYSPKNHDNVYHGPSLMITALAHSYNIVAIKLMQMLSIDKVIEYAHKMGITTKLRKTLSLALGTSEVKLIELATVYSVFANKGIKNTPYAIMKIVDKEGNVIYEANPVQQEILNECTSYVVTTMLQSVMTRGTGIRAKISVPCAGKTGTTQNCVDALFAGYTSDLVTAVYVGYDNPKSLGEHMYGGTVAGPIWKYFMEKAQNYYPGSDFDIPSGVLHEVVCSESGMQACEQCPSTLKTAFISGTQPVQSCPLHDPNQKGIFDSETASLLGEDQMLSEQEMNQAYFSLIPQERAYQMANSGNKTPSIQPEKPKTVNRIEKRIKNIRDIFDRLKKGRRTQ